MNTSKTIILAISGFITIGIFLLIIQILSKVLKIKADDNGKLKNSYAIWFASLFISASIIISKIMMVLNEAIDNIYKINISNLYVESVKLTSIFIGLGIIWFLIWYYISKFLIIMITGKRIDAIEMEADNMAYFLIQGVSFFVFVFCFLPIFEIILRMFMPNIGLPFYH